MKRAQTTEQTKHETEIACRSRITASEQNAYVGVVEWKYHRDDDNQFFDVLEWSVQQHTITK